MDYNDWLTAITTELQIADTYGVAAFSAVAPRAIEYAELRIYRELDFLATRAVDLTQLTLGGIRTVAIPSQFVVVEGVSLVTPTGHLPSDPGASRVPLLRTTRQFLDATWPTEGMTAYPAPFETYWALFSEQQAVKAPGSADEPAALPSTILIAPTPDDEYRVEFTGTMRPAPLSATNPTTFLTSYLPDLFLAATLVWGFGHQRDFGGQSDDPRTAQSWEQQYHTLRDGAMVEELRKKSAAPGWTPRLPNTIANQKPGGGP